MAPSVQKQCSTETLPEVKLATARSGFPSPLKSPTAIEDGLIPTGTGYVVAGAKFPAPSPFRIETVLSLKLVTARSRLPSLLKSPTATKDGLAPTAIVGVAAAEKPPAPSPKRIDTVPTEEQFGSFPHQLATARSRTPSPLRRSEER